jgi:hypothetical protein
MDYVIGEEVKFHVFRSKIVSAIAAFEEPSEVNLLLSTVDGQLLPVRMRPRRLRRRSSRPL